MNVAVTLAAAVIVTTHAPLPLHAPLQPSNRDPAAVAAVSVTVVPLAKLAAHVAPQSIPAGVDVTVPAPVPVFVTVSG